MYKRQVFGEEAQVVFQHLQAGLAVEAVGGIYDHDIEVAVFHSGVLEGVIDGDMLLEVEPDVYKRQEYWCVE